MKRNTFFNKNSNNNNNNNNNNSNSNSNSNDDMNNMNSMNTPYMFLRVVSKHPTGTFHQHRVGVIALEEDENNMVSIAGSIVSVSEPFNAKKGVAKAIGRLKSRGNHVARKVSKTDIQNWGLKYVCQQIGLKSEHNWFSQINWEDADRKFKSTFVDRIEHA